MMCLEGVSKEHLQGSAPSRGFQRMGLPAEHAVRGGVKLTARQTVASLTRGGGGACAAEGRRSLKCKASRSGWADAS